MRISLRILSPFSVRTTVLFSIVTMCRLAASKRVRLLKGERRE